jgi:hypothetical protein
MLQGNSTQLMKFIAMDGDDVGNLLRDRIIANDVIGIETLSKNLSEYFKELCALLSAKNYIVVLCAGDSLLAYKELDEVSPNLFAELPLGPCTISIGIGETPEYAYLALQLAKARGKRQTVQIKTGSAETIYRF